MVMFLFALAELIETLSLDRARNAIRGLMAMAPETATVRQADGSWREVPAKQVEIGALVRVRPGERIALDGVVTTGAIHRQSGADHRREHAGREAARRSGVRGHDQRGRCVRVPRHGGRERFDAGAHHPCGGGGAGAAARRRSASSIGSPASTRRPCSPWPCWSRWFRRCCSAQPWLEWIYQALVLLVIACPCALVISTPVTVVSGLAAAAQPRHPDQGRRLSGDRTQAQGAGAGQDRHAHPRQAGRDGLHSAGRRRRQHARSSGRPAWPLAPITRYRKAVAAYAERQQHICWSPPSSPRWSGAA